MTSAQPAGPDDLWAGLEGRLPRPAVPLPYLLGLLVVSLAMVLLPALYLALIVACGWLVAWWAVHGLSLLAGGGLGTLRIRLALFLVPLVAGGAVPVFLLKPFFARRTAAAHGLELDRRLHPAVFKFVERLALVVGCRAPTRITVDTQVNAGAGLELGLLRRRGAALVLNIGLPLAAGLTFPQFAGILAHEFGHFGQGAGMRLGRFIWGINAWFGRVVYERDGWDEGLERGIEEGGWASLACLSAKMTVGLGRKVLFALMVAGHAVSCFLGRQMEFDADLYTTHVAGSNAFAEAMFRVRLLGASSAYVYSSLLKERFVDDVPALIARVADNAPPRLMAAIKMDAQRSGTGLFDAHPSDLARLQRARSARLPGLVSGSAPAAALFHDFEGLCRRATRELYENALGRHAPSPDALLPVSAFVAAPQPPDVPSKAAKLEFPPERAPRLAAHLAAGSASETNPAAARAAWRERAPAAVPAIDAFRRAHAQWIDAGTAEAIMAAGFRVRPHEFSLPESTPEGIARTRARALEAQKEADGRIEAAERALAVRIRTALSTLASGGVGIPDAGQLHAESQRLLTLLPDLEQLQTLALPLRGDAATLETLLAVQRGGPAHAPLDEQIAARTARVHDAVNALRSALEAIAVPGPSWDIAPPWRDDPGSYVRAARRALDVLDGQHTRVVGQLVRAASRVEEAGGAACPGPRSRPLSERASKDGWG